MVKTSSIDGSGSISAIGGAGNQYYSNYGGGGSGGRIAIYHSSSNTFSGTIAAHGGITNAGGPGTIYVEDQTAGRAKLTVGNNNNAIDTSEITTMAATKGVAWISQAELPSLEFFEIELKQRGSLAIVPGTAVSLFIYFQFRLLLLLLLTHN